MDINTNGKNVNKFSSIYIDKYITQKLYEIDNPNAEQIKEKMERLKDIEEGKLTKNLSAKEAVIDNINLLSKKDGRVFFSVPVAQMAQLDIGKNDASFQATSNTCMTNDVFSGKIGNNGKYNNLSAVLQLAIQYHFLSETFEQKTTKDDNKDDNDVKKFLMIKEIVENLIEVAQDIRWENGIDSNSTPFALPDQVIKASNGGNKKYALNFVGAKDFDGFGVDKDPENNLVEIFSRGISTGVVCHNKAKLISWIDESETGELFSGMQRIYEANNIEFPYVVLGVNGSWTPIYIMQAVMHHIALYFKDEPCPVRQVMIGRFNALKEEIKSGKFGAGLAVDGKDMNIKTFNDSLAKEMVRAIVGEDKFNKLDKDEVAKFVFSITETLKNADHANQILKTFLNLKKRENGDGFISGSGPYPYLYMSLSAILKQFIFFLRDQKDKEGWTDKDLGGKMDEYISNLEQIIGNLSEIEGNFWKLPCKEFDLSKCETLSISDESKNESKIGLRKVYNGREVTSYKKPILISNYVTGKDIIDNMKRQKELDSLFDKGLEKVTNDQIAEYLKNNFGMKNDLIDEMSNDRLREIKEKFPDEYKLLYSRDYFQYKNDQFENNIKGNYDPGSDFYKKSVERLKLAPNSSFDRNFFDKTFGNFSSDIQTSFLDLKERDVDFISKCLKGIKEEALKKFQESYYDENKSNIENNIDKNKDNHKKNIFDELIQYYGGFSDEQLGNIIDLEKLSNESINIVVDRLLSSENYFGYSVFSEDSCIELLKRITSESTFNKLVKLIFDRIQEESLPIDIINQFTSEMFKKFSCDQKFVVLELLYNRSGEEKIKLKKDLVEKIDFYNDSKFSYGKGEYYHEVKSKDNNHTDYVYNDRKDVYKWFFENYCSDLTEEQCSLIDLSLIDKSEVKRDIQTKIGGKVAKFNEIGDGNYRDEIPEYFKTGNEDLFKHVFKYPILYKKHICWILELMADDKFKNDEFKGFLNTLRGSDFIGSLSLKNFKNSVSKDDMKQASEEKVKAISETNKKIINYLSKLFVNDLNLEQIQSIDLKLLSDENFVTLLKNRYEDLSVGQLKSLFGSINKQEDFKRIVNNICNVSKSLKEEVEKSEKGQLSEGEKKFNEAEKLLEKFSFMDDGFWPGQAVWRNKKIFAKNPFIDVQDDKDALGRMLDIYERMKEKKEGDDEIKRFIENKEKIKIEKKLENGKKIKIEEKLSETFEKDCRRLTELVGPDNLEKIYCATTDKDPIEVLSDLLQGGFLGDKKVGESVKIKEKIIIKSNNYDPFWTQALSSLNLGFLKPGNELSEDEKKFFELILYADKDEDFMDFTDLKKINCVNFIKKNASFFVRNFIKDLKEFQIKNIDLSSLDKETLNILVKAAFKSLSDEQIQKINLSLLDKEVLNILVKAAFKSLKEEQIQKIDLSLLDSDNLETVFYEHCEHLKTDQFANLFGSLREWEDFKSVVTKICSVSERLEKEGEVEKRKKYNLSWIKVLNLYKYLDDKVRSSRGRNEIKLSKDEIKFFELILNVDRDSEALNENDLVKLLWLKDEKGYSCDFILKNLAMFFNRLGGNCLDVIEKIYNKYADYNDYYNPDLDKDLIKLKEKTDIKELINSDNVIGDMPKIELLKSFEYLSLIKFDELKKVDFSNAVGLSFVLTESFVNEQYREFCDYLPEPNFEDEFDGVKMQKFIDSLRSKVDFTTIFEEVSSKIKECKKYEGKEKRLEFCGLCFLYSKYSSIGPKMDYSFGFSFDFAKTVAGKVRERLKSVALDVVSELRGKNEKLKKEQITELLDFAVEGKDTVGEKFFPYPIGEEALTSILNDFDKDNEIFESKKYLDRFISCIDGNVVDKVCMEKIISSAEKLNLSGEEYGKLVENLFAYSKDLYALEPLIEKLADNSIKSTKMLETFFDKIGKEKLFIKDEKGFKKISNIVSVFLSKLDAVGMNKEIYEADRARGRNDSLYKFNTETIRFLSDLMHIMEQANGYVAFSPLPDVDLADNMSVPGIMPDQHPRKSKELKFVYDNTLLKRIINKLGVVYVSEFQLLDYILKLGNKEYLDFDIYKTLIDTGIEITADPYGWSGFFEGKGLNIYSFVKDSETCTKVINYNFQKNFERTDIKFFKEYVEFGEKNEALYDDYIDSIPDNQRPDSDFIKRQKALNYGQPFDRFMFNIRLKVFIKEADEFGSEYKYNGCVPLVKENLLSLRRFYLFFDNLIKVDPKEYGKELISKIFSASIMASFTEGTFGPERIMLDKFGYNRFISLKILLDIVDENKINVEPRFLEVVTEFICHYASGANVKAEVKIMACAALTKMKKLYNNDKEFEEILSKNKRFSIKDGEVFMDNVTKDEINSFEHAMNDCYVEVVGDKVITKNDKIKAEKAEDEKETESKKVNLSKIRRLNGPGQKKEDKKEEKSNDNRGDGNKQP